jgi:3HB-oligomer hydrolase (3HBOH)
VEVIMTRRRLAVLVTVLGLVWFAPAAAWAGCPEILSFLAGKAVDVGCFDSSDLTTNNAQTTPTNNSLPGLPPLAFTPQTDRGVISPNPPDRTPIAGPVPGIQVEGYLAGDPAGEARFLLRLPHNWNGRLVVAGASGTRSEFNGDFAWSDYVVQKGYAYASQNKRVLNFRLTTPGDPLGCRLNPTSTTFVHFYINDLEKSFTEWTDAIVENARLARDILKVQYRKHPGRTYAVGTSNGGYQVRRAIEAAPDLFDGGVDWEGTFVDPVGPNILIDLPPALKNFPAYVASGFDPNSPAAQAIRAAGYPPDILNGLSLWATYWSAFWEVTACQWQKKLDPTYDTYGAGLENYDYAARVDVSDVEDAFAAFATTGKIKKPLVTVAGTMDALLPIDRHARAYQAKVAASRKGNNDERNAQYRLYEIQNGNHVDSFRSFFPLQLEYLQPHAQRAFELLVDHVENRAPLPPEQCVPRGGVIAATPAQPGHCTTLFVP